MKATTVAVAIALGLAGCATSPSAKTKEPDEMAVSVSAANYSKLSDEELYASVNAPANNHPETPAGSVAMKPLLYLLLPGQVYENDLPLDSVYAYLEGALEERGYYNVVYQMRRGLKPTRIDYILRVHFGGRTWLTPSVRMDRITWGNDGIVANKFAENPPGNGRFDPRVGLSVDEEMQVRSLFAIPGLPTNTEAGGEGPVSYRPDEHDTRDGGMDSQLAKDYCMVIVEAFKLDDVKALDKKAPCIWTTFIAVPVDRGQKFSSVLQAMLKAGAPYFGTTTNGLQIQEVPTGKVILGNPVELPPRQESVAPGTLSNPSVRLRP